MARGLIDLASKTNPFGAFQPLFMPTIWCFDYAQEFILKIYHDISYIMIYTMMATRPNPLQPKLTSISETQTCNGPDWPGGQNNQDEPFVFSFEIIWRQNFPKNMIKKPLLFQIIIRKLV